MKHHLATGLGILLLASQASSQTLRHARITTPQAQAVATSLERQGYGILEGSITANSFELIDSEANLTFLRAEGYAPQVLAVGRPFREIQEEMPPPAGYQDLAQVYARMNQVAANFPNIAQVVDITSTYGAPQTFEGRNIFGLKISDNVAIDEDEPANLIVSAHHVRELVTVVIAFEIIDELTQNYGSIGAITNIVDGNETWIVPVWNPDGYEYVFNVDNFWRKNRRVFGGGVGVDLNRNYRFRWNGPCGGSTNQNSETYRGPSAGSEAETRTMEAFTAAEQFDRVLDYHSFGRETLWSYASCSTYAFDNYLRQTAITISQQSGYGNSIRPPSAEGEHYEWQQAKRGAFAFLIETHSSFQPSFASANAEAQQVTPGALWFLQQPIPISGKVTDAISGDPVSASITYDGFPFLHNEVNPTEPETGRYRAFMPSGPKTITVQSPGYIDRKEAYLIQSGQGIERDLEMVPVGACPTATVTTRTHPSNPNVYTATPAVVGQPVTFTVDTQGFNFATIFAVLVPAARPSDRGLVHVEVDSPRVFVFGPLTGPIAQGQMVVAPDISLCGMIIYTQAKIHNATGPFQVTNSQDLLVGL